MSCILGILGARNSITKQIMQDEILNPILNDLANKPSKILMPSEPISSTYVECWAQRAGIQCFPIKSDWVANGRRAGVVRDLQIQKECNAFLVFEGPKSRYYMDLATRIAKNKGCPVYVVEAKTVSPVLLEVDQVIDINEKDEADILTLPKMWSTKPTTCLITDD
jgi:hypothetical protein